MADHHKADLGEITEEDAPSFIRGLLGRFKSLPGPIRKSLVISIGGVLIIIGGMLIVLPGPFTLPFVIAGVAILSTEFAWAGMLLRQTQRFSARFLRLLRNPWILLAALLVVAVVSLSVYTYFVPDWWH